MTEQAEQTLFLRAQAGDRAAFDALQKYLDSPVRRFIRRLIGVRPEEDDITRDVFLALYQNLTRISPVENLRPFLFRIVRNLSYSELRRQGRFQVVSLDDVVGGPHEPCTQRTPFRGLPDLEAQWLLMHREVQTAIQHLPELQRQTLILYAEEDLTYAQIAEAMATDMGTVKSRLFYARKNLTRWLAPEILAALGLPVKENLL